MTGAAHDSRDAVWILRDRAEMNVSSTISKFILLLLSLSVQRCPLLLACCQLLKGCCNVTVEPAPLFQLGSNLTVYCGYKNCGPRSKVLLVLNEEIVPPKKRIDSTTTMYHLFNVQEPLSVLRCVLQRDSGNRYVGGLDLQGGLPPDSPGNVVCEATRNSRFIGCSWERGQETHLPKAYNVSLKRENGSEVLFDQVENAEMIYIPRSVVDGDTTFQLTVTAHNHFGTSESHPYILSVKDIVIPETPHIIQLQFGNNSKTALLQWNTTEFSGHLAPFVRLRTVNGSWEAGNTRELYENVVRVDDLWPLTFYVFQMRACHSGARRTDTPVLRSRTGQRSLCSTWSPSVSGRSPGKGPSQRLDVWRSVGSQAPNGLRTVKVLWKPPSVEDYSGKVQQYKIWTDQKQEFSCPAASNQCTVKVSEVAQALSISAVTLYGASPPADLPLKHSGESGPILKELAPAANGSGVRVSWSWQSETKQQPAAGSLYHYVVEWTSEPAAEPQWQIVAKDRNSTVITGLTAGVRYNISLYAVASSGVSTPCSALVYSEEEEPVSGPYLSVLVHEAGQIHIQWDELPVHQRKGFIKHYTIYIQPLDAINAEFNVTLPASEHRHKWLDCPKGALALEMTASTSAGEGRRGVRVSSRPTSPKIGLAIVIIFIVAVIGGILTNVLCWSCVRKRIKQKYISWRPAWFGQRLLKPGNSVAIRLLKHDGNEPAFLTTDTDPPLSPISLVSLEEGDDEYPNVHVKTSQAGSGQATAGTPLLPSHPLTALADSQLEHVSYKPQIALPSQHDEDVTEAEEEQWDTLTSGEGNGCSSGRLGGFLSSVELDFSDVPLELTLSSCPLWHKSLDSAIVLDAGLLPGSGLAEARSLSPSAGAQRQQEIMTRDRADAYFSQSTLEPRLIDGYLPQVAAVCCDAQR